MQQRNVIDPSKNFAEEPLEKALRPGSLSEFIGQKKLCENLEIFIKAAKKRGEALDHILLAGPPGLGKTTLSQIVAKELGVGFRATSGPVITKAGDLAAILTNLQENDVLFIDEIHRLNKTVEEILYPAMEDNKLDLIIGEGAGARSVQIDLPQFTLVAATTRSGLLSTPLRERFGIPLRLDFYTPEELSSIVERSGKLLNMQMSKDGALEIASRSRGTPRVANRLTRRVRDISSVMEQDIINENVADMALSRLDVDKNGLDAWDIKYLTLMAGNYAGGPVGIETMAASLGEERDVIEDVIEPYLLQQGYIARTPRGRCLTNKSYKYLGINAVSDSQAPNGDLFSQEEE